MSMYAYTKLQTAQ